MLNLWEIQCHEEENQIIKMESSDKKEKEFKKKESSTIETEEMRLKCPERRKPRSEITSTL